MGGGACGDATKALDEKVRRALGKLGRGMLGSTGLTTTASTQQNVSRTKRAKERGGTVSPPS